MNHNVPLIGDIEQVEGREHCAHHVVAGENGVQMDIAGAYPADAGVKSIHRAFALDAGEVRLHDQIELEHAQEVTWVFMLRKPPKLAPGLITFGPLTLHHDESLEQTVTEMPVTDVRLKKNFPGSLWRLALTAEKNDSFDQRFVITRS